MANNFFITGLPKCGKTTLLCKLVKEMKGKGIKVGGFISPEEKAHGTRTGFKVQDIETGKKATLAALDVDGPKVAKYHVNIKSFEWLALPAMRGMNKYDVMVIDEIGRMEMKSTKFQDLLEKLLHSDVPLIASLHRDYIEDYKAWGEVLVVTPSNRGRVYFDLLNRVDGHKKVPAKKKAKKAAAKKAPAKKAARKKRAIKKAAKKKARKKKAGKKKPAKKKPPARKKPSRPEPPTAEEEEELMAKDITSHKEEKKEGKEEKKEEKKEEEGGFRSWVREHLGV